MKVESLVISVNMCTVAINSQVEKFSRFVFSVSSEYGTVHMPGFFFSVPALCDAADRRSNIDNVS